MPAAFDLERLERNLNATRAELKYDLALLGQTLTVGITQINWMLGSLMVINVAIALKLFLN